MNAFFRRLPLPVKLMLIGLIPLALLIYFAIQIYNEKTGKLTVLRAFLENVDRSSRISSTVDELQSERRFSFGYVINKDWKPELAMQRPRTDAAIQALSTLGGGQLASVQSYTFLDSLSSIRSRVDQNRLSPLEVMNYYTNTIFRLNTLNNASMRNIEYLQSVSKELAGQKLLSELVTYLGILRANVYYDLYAGETGGPSVEGLKSVWQIFRSFETEFLIKGSDSSIIIYKQLARQGALAQTISYLQNAMAQTRLDSSIGVENWWQLSATAVDQVRQIQRNELQKVQKGVNNIFDRETKERDRTLFFVVLGIALVLFFVSYTIFTITSMLSELNRAAMKIAAGDTGVQIHSESKDALGSLAKSIKAIDQNNRQLSEAAAAIGSGNFEVDVTPRSAEDQLGNAVVKMRNDLQQYSLENEAKAWVSQGLLHINDSIRGEKEPAALSADALDALTDFVNAEIGLLYLRYEGFLRLTATHAVPNASELPQEIKEGETLVGQASRQKKVIELNSVPEDFVKIKTGTGEASPRHVIILPLVHNDQVEGVIEIASLQPFHSQTLNLLNQIQNAIAIALQAGRSRARLQELFEETQAQSEELQAQHNELENINAELEAQTEKLQASEEELRVQQEELVEANGELEERSRLLEERNQLIVERNLEIQKKAEELAVSTRYKSEFLANMSHELRTPLNSILLLSRLLSENNEKNMSPDQVEYASVIQSSGQGLLSLIDEILDLSKIEAGKMDLEYSKVSIDEVVGDMKALFSPIARERGVELQVNVSPQIQQVIETDKQRLEQILKNLLSNALKFTSKGSVTLSVAPLEQDTNFLQFSVRDTGIGIPADKQQLIFEAFQQADGSTRRKYGGTGLGLSISRELTRLLGGEIRVTSEPGKGSEFKVFIPTQKMKAVVKPAMPELPVPTPPPADEESTEEEKPAPRQNLRMKQIPQSLPDDRADVEQSDKTILIVEDDTAFAKALLDFTHKKGYKGLVAVRGDEGVELAIKYKPVGILLDIQLPVKDGWEVMEELKANPATRHIPVHIMSSLEAKRESLMKGAVDFINKPVAFEQMQEVFKKIETVLSRENKKVLIVEENPKHAQALAYFLETFNVNARISTSVNQSEDALRRDDVDCVILDMGIPDQRAYETLDDLKKKPGLEGLPIIIFTGKNLSKAEESRIKQYADSIVVKTAHSYQRILDEVSLFLHLMEENNQPERQVKYKRLGALNEVLSGKKILIADDDVRNIFSLSKVLEVHNMKVFSAVDGKEALQQLEENPDMDVVLMDIMMPEMDGFEAIQRIRRNFQFRNLPVIAVTAKAMTGDREKCIKAGASDYISKPVDIDQLLSLLRVWLYEKNS